MIIICCLWLLRRPLARSMNNLYDLNTYLSESRVGHAVMKKASECVDKTSEMMIELAVNE